MIPDGIRSWWAEPRPDDAPGPLPRDWLLVALLAGWSLVESMVRDDLAPTPLLVIAAAAVLCALPWRRTHPSTTIAAAFGALLFVDGIRIVANVDGVLPFAVLATLVLAYAGCRWGSGREALTGLGLILVWLAATCVADETQWVEAFAGYAIFLFAAALGTTVRLAARARRRDIERAKARERAQLARELHDTVAHHVTGIAIQAQAGRAVAATRPDRAAEALATIEDAATRTLGEMRALVGVLRASEEPDLVPQPGLAELVGLATDGGSLPRVEVSLTGDLEQVSPAVAAAVFRIAQESVTNARRHARRAGQVSVRVAGGADDLRLTIEDDGAPGQVKEPKGGFGLVGMRERALLLGGTFEAGPRDGGGWRVDVRLPRVGGSQ